MGRCGTCSGAKGHLQWGEGTLAVGRWGTSSGARGKLRDRDGQVIQVKNHLYHLLLMY